MVFSVAAIALVGMISLGTEVANWYLERAAAQNAADSAAVAAALAASDAIAAGDADDAVQSAAEDAATDAATRNAFTGGGHISVTANYPPVSGSHTTTTGATEVLISATLAPVLATLIDSSASVTVSTRAVGLVTSTGKYACVLSTAGDMTISGSQSSTNCTYASNATDANAIIANASATFSAYGASAVGGCNNCGTSLTRPAAPYQPPTTNPYKSAIDANFSTISSDAPACAAAFTVTAGQTTVLGPATSGGVVTYCASSIPASNLNTATTPNTFNIASGSWELHPGTYFLQNLSLNITGGVVACVQTTGALCTSASTGSQGVTIVLTGGTSSSNTGNVTIGSGSTVQLPAPKTNGTSTALNGMLFYRDPNAPSGSGSSVVTINGSSKVTSMTIKETGKAASVTSELLGGIYFPNAYVTYGGNSSSRCAIVVAGYLTVTAATISNLTCSGYLGTNMPQLQAAQLVE